MRITNWKYKGNRNIIISNDNIVSGRDQPRFYDLAETVKRNVSEMWTYYARKGK